MNITYTINRLVRNKKFLSGLAGLFFLTLIFTSLYSTAPINFPIRIVVPVKDGATLSEVASTLQGDNIIRSQFLYKVYVVLLGGRKKVLAGKYLFDHKESTLTVAWRTVNGDQGLPKIKVTLPEGIASYDIARLLAAKLPDFDSKAFLTLAKPDEGYLFPDTYYFNESMSPQDVIDTMKANFDKQIKNQALAIGASGRSEADIIKMASIVEKEATSTKDRQIIAGILWKRIDSKYPLQVDPPFFYILGKNSNKLTMADLASDSPYNLYTHKGLPPTAIDNPGMDAIEATLTPVKTKYWFYLSDSKGITHYAETNDGHLANREKYMQ